MPGRLADATNGQLLAQRSRNYDRRIHTTSTIGYYWEFGKIQLKEIDVVFTGTYDTMLAAYRSGEYPIAWLTSANLDTYRHSPDYHATSVLGDVWLDMNSHIALFTNKDFRLAVAYAIDRDAITKGVDHGANVTQYGWYPPGILGYDPNVQAQPGVPYYNPTIAKQHLAAALKVLGSVPPITLEFRSENPDVARELAEVQANLKAVGISITLHPVPRSTWVNDGNSGKTQFIWGDWYDDYPDPQDFSDYLLRTRAGENRGRYSNPTVDKLFDQANVTTDTAKRKALLQQAQLLIARCRRVSALHLRQSGTHQPRYPWTGAESELRRRAATCRQRLGQRYGFVTDSRGRPAANASVRGRCGPEWAAREHETPLRAGEVGRELGATS